MTTQEGLPALAMDEREVEDLMRVILRAWKPCSSPQGHPHMEWAEIAARAVHKERDARIEAAERRVKELRKALSASAGYLMNAKIDLETGAKKATAINTIEGGLRVVSAALEAKSHDD